MKKVMVLVFGGALRVLWVTVAWERVRWAELG